MVIMIVVLINVETLYGDVFETQLMSLYDLDMLGNKRAVLFLMESVIVAGK